MASTFKKFNIQYLKCKEKVSETSLATCLYYEAKPGLLCKQLWLSGPQPRTQTLGSVPQPSPENELAGCTEPLQSCG